MKKKLRTIIFPVAGFGTRFLPATKAIPKEMLPVVDKPLIQYAFEEAVEAGFEKFIFITGRNKNSIENHFDHAFELQTVLSESKKNETLNKVISWVPQPGQIAFLRQQKAMGLGHAVLCAKNFIMDEPFAVSLADEMIKREPGNSFLKEMVELYNSKNEECNIISVNDVEAEEVSKYGCIGIKSQNGNIIEINDMVEKPKKENAPSNTVITGRYIFQPKIFELLENTKAGKNEEIQLTDAMKTLMKTNKFYGLKFDKSERFDCGSPPGFLKANIAYAIDKKDMKEEMKNIIKEFYNIIK